MSGCSCGLPQCLVRIHLDSVSCCDGAWPFETRRRCLHDHWWFARGPVGRRHRSTALLSVLKLGPLWLGTSSRVMTRDWRLVVGYCRSGGQARATTYSCADLDAGAL